MIRSFPPGEPGLRFSRGELNLAPNMTRRFQGPLSIYPVGDPVGKSSEQIARTDDGKFEPRGDKEVYERWAQALSSANDLIHSCTLDGEEIGATAFSVAIPMLVVPDGTLWTILFDESGDLVQSPQPVNRCSYYVARSYRYRNGISSWTSPIQLSHLEIVIVTGVKVYIDEHCNYEPSLKKLIRTNWET